MLSSTHPLKKTPEVYAEEINKKTNELGQGKRKSEAKSKKRSREFSVEGIAKRLRRRLGGSKSEKNPLEQNSNTLYAEEIFKNLKENEDSFWEPLTVKEFYTGKSENITQNHRVILIDWLIEVAQCYNFCSQTLFYAVQYLDRFLSQYPITPQLLQLAGITCLFIAAKYEETFLPPVSEFANITACTYTPLDILHTEIKILNTLKFRLTEPTVLSFLVRFLFLSEMKPSMVHLANYLAELSLLSLSIKLKYKPSMIAAAIIYITNYTFSRPPLTPLFESFTGYKQSELEHCINDLYSLHKQITYNTNGVSSVKEKYARKEYDHISQYSLKPRQT